jgi:RNA polymerase sigma-70 factor (ECF subfamily)
VDQAEPLSRSVTVERAARGDRSAQADLLTELQDPWFRLCLSLLRGDAERACDATQETALRFLRLLPRFRGESQLRTWSFGIAINVVREMRRREIRSDTVDERRLAIDMQRVAGAPDQDAAASEEKRMLREVMQDLPERQREAIVLRFFEELSVEDAAAAMNCAPGTVKATVHQALRSLKDRLTRRRVS